MDWVVWIAWRMVGSKGCFNHDQLNQGWRLDHLTLRKGSPHQLVRTKNDKSHQHALALREKDRPLLATLNRI